MVIEDIINLAANLDPQSADFEQRALENLESYSTDLTITNFNKELSQWILAGKLCEQLNVYNNFGQPPVTLFNNGEFVIDLYFWLYSDTSIHTHSFKGAFKVLFGKSQQEIFKIEKEEEFLKDVRFNKYNIIEQKVLTASHCQVITQGDQFCHRVIHMDSPTVTLCIRTINNRDIPQWHQFENGLSILKVEIPENTYKSMYYFQYLIQENQQEAQRFIRKLVSDSSASLILNLFEEALSGSLGLDDETLEVFQNTVLKKYNNQKWFQLYLDECS